jgi:hypothetical protein
MHRAADDADIIDGIRQPHLRRNLLSHGRINLPVACLRPGARGIALRVLSPRAKLREIAERIGVRHVVNLTGCPIR